MSRLFQLDMVKPAEGASLGPAVMAELTRACEALARLAQDRREDALDRFRKSFTERYEDRQVPLLEALDEEVGIGFDRSSDHGAEASPLLHGLALGGPPGPPRRVRGGPACGVNPSHGAYRSSRFSRRYPKAWRRASAETRTGGPLERHAVSSIGIPSCIRPAIG